MYFRARYYSPELGRFISRDPLAFVDGMNLYVGYFAIHGKTAPWGYNELAEVWKGIGTGWGVAVVDPTPASEVAMAAATVGAVGYSAYKAAEMLWDWITSDDTSTSSTDTDASSETGSTTAFPCAPVVQSKKQTKSQKE